MEKRETVQTTEDAHHTKNNNLVLNNGAKWKSDENTNGNVAQLEATVSAAIGSQSKLTAGFTTIADSLQTGLDKMVKECRMQGPDHEALHQWLEPLMKNVKELKTAGGEEQASTLINDINQQLNEYHQYFE
jgi:hypothetical protein